MSDLMSHRKPANIRELTKHQHYEFAKEQFRKRYPNATPAQYEAYIRELIKRLKL